MCRWRLASSQCATEMWDLEVLVRDSGMSVVFAAYSSKKRDCCIGNYASYSS